MGKKGYLLIVVLLALGVVGALFYGDIGLWSVDQNAVNYDLDNYSIVFEETYNIGFNQDNQDGRFSKIISAKNLSGDFIQVQAEPINDSKLSNFIINVWSDWNEPSSSGKRVVSNDGFSKNGYYIYEISSVSEHKIEIVSSKSQDWKITFRYFEEKP